MRTEKKKPRWYDPDEFYLARHRAGLTREKAADMLDVTPRTLRNWENGSSRIPYAAFRLMRLIGGHALVGQQWEGWCMWRGKLWTPAGRSFEAHELQRLGSYLWMARQWLAEQQASASADEVVCSFTAAAGGAPGLPSLRSASGSPCGAAPRPEDLGGSFEAAGLQGKTIAVSPPCLTATLGGISSGENTPEFRSIDDGEIPLNIDDLELEAS